MKTIAYAERVAARDQEKQTIIAERDAEHARLAAARDAATAKADAERTAVDRAFEAEVQALDAARAASFAPELAALCAKFADAPRATTVQIIALVREHNAAARAELGADLSALHIQFAMADVLGVLPFCATDYSGMGRRAPHIANAVLKDILAGALPAEVEGKLRDLEIEVCKAAKSAADENNARRVRAMRACTTAAAMSSAKAAVDEARKAEGIAAAKAAYEAEAPVRAAREAEMLRHARAARGLF